MKQSTPKRTQFVLTLAAILLVGFALVNLAHYRVSESSVREALIESELPLTSNNIYSEIQASLLRPIHISSLMANDTFLKDWVLEGEQEVTRITRYLNEIREKYGVASTFVVSDVTRRYYHFNGVLKQVSPEVPKDAWFFSMETHPDPYRVDVDINEANRGRLTIFINHKLLDYDGNFLGVTGLGLDVATVSELIQRYKQDYQRDIYFVDRAGKVKGHGDDNLVDSANIHEQPGIAQVAPRILADEQGFVEYPLAGDNVLLAYRYVPELDWYLLVEQRESAALAPLRQALYYNVGLSLLVTVIVLLVSGYTASRFQRRLESLARTDKLTGLVNRQYFDLLFEQELREIGRRSRTLSVIVFDIDHFKAVNDRHGHLVGDRVLARVAFLAQLTTRGSDVACRWGGDEFLILLPDCGEADAVAVAEKLRAEVGGDTSVPGLSEPVTISAGVAEYRRGDSYMSLLDRADRALYQAKRDGRDRVGRLGRGEDPAPRRSAGD